MEPKRTLHDAIVSVLRKHQRMMTTAELANEINSSRLYMKKDGSPVQPFQIFLRCRGPRYRRLFSEVTKEGITL